MAAQTALVELSTVEIQRDVETGSSELVERLLFQWFARRQFDRFRASPPPHSTFLLFRKTVPEDTNGVTWSIPRYIGLPTLQPPVGITTKDAGTEEFVSLPEIKTSRIFLGSLDDR